MQLSSHGTPTAPQQRYKALKSGVFQSKMLVLTFEGGPSYMPRLLEAALVCL